MDEYLPRSGLFNADAWSNSANGVGIEGTDRRLSNEVCINFIGQSEADALYHADDMMARVVDLPPDEMTRAGIELTNDPQEKIKQPFMQLDALGACNQAMKWGRQSGAGYIFLGAFDGHKVDQPLDEKSITAFEHLTVFDRWEVTVHSLYGNPLLPKYGEPQFYRLNPTLVTSSQGQPPQVHDPMQLIHESRFIRFDGILTKRSIRQLNEYVSMSVLERCRDVIRDFVMSHHSAAIIVQDFGQRTYGIDGLAQMLSADQEGLLIKRLKLMDRARSLLHAAIIDAEKETLTASGMPVSGMDDLLYQIGIRLSAATGIPLTLLLGESPGGMNATGESDHRNFYNVISAMQETILRPALARILRLIARVGGKRKVLVDEQVPFVFRPLWQPSEIDIAKARWDNAQADNVYLTTGVLSPDDVRKRFAGSHYSVDIAVPPGSKAPGPPTPPAAPKAPGAKPPSGA